MPCVMGQLPGDPGMYKETPPRGVPIKAGIDNFFCKIGISRHLIEIYIPVICSGQNFILPIHVHIFNERSGHAFYFIKKRASGVVEPY